MKRTLATAVLAASSLMLVPPAQADTPSCVSHTEFNNMTWGLTPAEVYNRFDIFGSYLGDSPGNQFRRGYDACWTNERQVVVWYSYDTNESVDWAVRDL